VGNSNVIATDCTDEARISTDYLSTNDTDGSQIVLATDCTDKHRFFIHK